MELMDTYNPTVQQLRLKNKQLRQRVQELTAERDKATQYWQIAEGRCDALKQQRDELLAELEELSLYVAYNGDDWVQKKAKAAIASVKEK